MNINDRDCTVFCVDIHNEQNSPEKLASEMRR